MPFVKNKTKQNISVPELSSEGPSSCRTSPCSCTSRRRERVSVVSPAEDRKSLSALDGEACLRSQPSHAVPKSFRSIPSLQTGQRQPRL